MNIERNLLEKSGIVLSTSSLVYGSILPDIQIKLKSIKHFKQDSYDIVINMILDTFNNAVKYNQPVKVFSKNLGIVMHFVSDFFCYPHNERVYFENRITEHMVYEYKLHNLFKHAKDLELVSAPEIQDISYESIKNFLDELHYQYSKNTQSLENDILFTYSSVLPLSEYLSVCYAESTLAVPAIAYQL